MTDENGEVPTGRPSRLAARWLLAALASDPDAPAQAGALEGVELELEDYLAVPDGPMRAPVLNLLGVAGMALHRLAAAEGRSVYDTLDEVWPGWRS